MPFCDERRQSGWEAGCAIRFYCLIFARSLGENEAEQIERGMDSLGASPAGAYSFARRCSGEEPQDLDQEQNKSRRNCIKSLSKLKVKMTTDDPILFLYVLVAEPRLTQGIFESLFKNGDPKQRML